MKDLPNAFWATLLIGMACALVVMAMYAPAKENVVMAVISFAASIGTGAYGYIQGHKDGAASVPTNPGAPPASGAAKE